MHFSIQMPSTSNINIFAFSVIGRDYSNAGRSVGDLPITILSVSNRHVLTTQTAEVHKLLLTL